MSLPVLSMQKPHPKTRPQTTPPTNHTHTWGSQQECGQHRHWQRGSEQPWTLLVRLFQGETGTGCYPQAEFPPESLQCSVWGCTGTITQGVTKLLQSTFLPHSQGHTNSQQMGTELLGLIFWQNHIPQDNRDYTPNTAPSHLTPHPAPFCLRIAYGGDGHEMSPTVTKLL